MIKVEETYVLANKEPGDGRWVLITAHIEPGKFPQMWWYEIDVRIADDPSKFNDEIPTLYWEHSGSALTLRRCWHKAEEKIWDVWEAVKEEYETDGHTDLPVM